MPHGAPLISLLTIGLGLTFVFGMIATRLKPSPLVGYLIAGVAIGPFTPGFVGDAQLATQLAEIGVILLMFGVGLHFSLDDLLSVRAIALPGALAQIFAATLLGVGMGYLMGWPLEGGIVFGLALSVASTVVLLRVLQERHVVQTERGRIAEIARQQNPAIRILARSHSDAEAEHMAGRGADVIISGEEEIAQAMIDATGPRLAGA